VEIAVGRGFKNGEVIKGLSMVASDSDRLSGLSFFKLRGVGVQYGYDSTPMSE
jgi:hypothetical protein